MKKHPEYDWGNPGSFAHFMEQYSRKGYEEKLIKSIERRPTYNTVFLISRCVNAAASEDEYNQYLALLKRALAYPGLNTDTKNSIERVIERMED